jgi:hypothetical protein
VSFAPPGALDASAATGHVRALLVVPLDVTAIGWMKWWMTRSAPTLRSEDGGAGYACRVAASNRQVPRGAPRTQTDNDFAGVDVDRRSALWPVTERGATELLVSAGTSFAGARIFASVRSSLESLPVSSVTALLSVFGASTTTTSPPSRVERWNEGLGNLRTLVSNIAALLLIVGTTVIVVVAISAVWRRRRTYRVVLSEVRNGSGVTSLDSVTPGLSELLRQQLGDELEVVRDRIRDHRAKFQIKVPKDMSNEQLPDAKLDEAINQLAQSLQEASGKARGLVQLLFQLVRPRGLTIATMLQRQPARTGRVGFSFSVVDIHDDVTIWQYTFWESRAPLIADPLVDGRQTHERYSATMTAAASALAVVTADVRMRSKVTKRHEKARISNFTGTLFLGLGAHYAHRPGDDGLANQYYDLAANFLRRALREWPEWYEPDLHLGEVFSYRAEIESEPDRWHRKARESLDAALEKTRQQRETLEGEFASEHQRFELERIAEHERDARLNRAFEFLYLDPARADDELQDLTNGWRADDEMDGTYLFNLMSWWVRYGELQSTSLSAWRPHASRYLACSIARDDERGSAEPRWRWAIEQDEVRILFGSRDAAAREVTRFRDAWQAIAGTKAVALVGETFSNLLNRAASSAGWSIREGVPS